MRFISITLTLFIFYGCSTVYGSLPEKYGAILKEVLPNEIKKLADSNLTSTIANHVKKSIQELSKKVNNLKSQGEKKKPESTTTRICIGLSAKLENFVAQEKVEQMANAIRSMVSETYHHLSTKSTVLLRKHKLKLDEEKNGIVLKRAVSAVGATKIIFDSAVGKFGKSVVKKVKSFHPSLTKQQVTTLESGFSAWIGKKHIQLQRLLRRSLRQHNVHLSRPEVQEVVAQIVRKMPTKKSQNENINFGMITTNLIAALRSRFERLKTLRSKQAANLQIIAQDKLIKFIQIARYEVKALLAKHNVSLTKSQLDELLVHMRKNLPPIVQSVHRYLRREAAKVLDQMHSRGHHTDFNTAQLEAYVREMVRLGNVLAERLAHRNISALFVRQNVTANAQALLGMVHDALLERSGIIGLGARELRMKVRMELPYIIALKFANAFKREMRREIARVARVLISEVEIDSMDQRTAVHFRIVAPAFDPKLAERRLKEAIAERRFSIRIESQRVYAVMAPHLAPPPNHLPWSVMIGSAIAVAVIVLALTISAIIVAVRRRRQMALEADDRAAGFTVIGGSSSGSKIPYAKVEEPDTVCA